MVAAAGIAEKVSETLKKVYTHPGEVLQNASVEETSDVSEKFIQTVQEKTEQMRT